MKNLAVFASGSGSNAERLVEYFKDSDLAQVKLILCNNPSAGVIQRAERLNIPLVLFNRSEFKSDKIVDLLKENEIDWVVLAGFLWLIPSNLVAAFPNKIINIHHSFLPAFPGAKPYHSAFARGVKIIGATSHYVTEDLDEGPIIEQDITRVSHSHSIEDFITKAPDSMSKAKYSTMRERSVGLGVIHGGVRGLRCRKQGQSQILQGVRPGARAAGCGCACACACAAATAKTPCG